MQDIMSYGRCVTCGAPGKTRERRPNGNTTCENGHTHSSAAFDRHAASARKSVGLGFEDSFNGNTDQLLGSAKALLELDAAGALVPHGIGGHARKIINALAARLEAA